ncbi:tetratricopeptide repeat protein [uncultured Paludibaculum sp.]|uniref:tetratricopeptide repeat protein n=1 Tax=uncultured Paludibaculum sp. TaxID=1765020 RepID=UPI002AAB5807|nr:tetratricopeptide repeat protein [uncultured Paludibaculum sp.]
MTRFFITKALLALALSLSLLPAQTANPKTPQPKGQKEQEAIMAMFQAQDPDARIAAANNLITKFSETEFKATALYITAFSYQQKNDAENTVVFAEKCLEADPKFFGAQIMIASGLASRTKEFDLDKEEKLGRAEKMAKAALELIPTAPKPNPQIPDDQWDAAKKDFLAQAHEALGLSAMVRKKYDVCSDEFKFSIDNASTPDPAVMLRLASCQIKVNKLDDALAMVDKALADPNAHPQVKAAATQLKMDINKAKSAAK